MAEYEDKERPEAGTDGGRKKEWTERRVMHSNSDERGLEVMTNRLSHKG